MKQYIVETTETTKQEPCILFALVTDTIERHMFEGIFRLDSMKKEISTS